MSIITSTKRERKNITRAMCEKKVAKQTKYHDAQVKGLYVSVTPNGVAVFNLKFTCPSSASAARSRSASIMPNCSTSITRASRQWR
jgi:hypothetical protein